MKLFHLDRIEDETGISGTGRVAEGVVFSDGTCAMRWLTAHKSTAVYSSVDDVKTIHGHGGRTRVVVEGDCHVCGELCPAGADVCSVACHNALCDAHTPPTTPGDES